MIDFIVQHFLSSLAGVLGLSGILVVILFAIAWFVPPLRPYAVSAIGAIIAAATIYTKGNRDATRKWNEAIERDVQKGEQARADAERDVAAGRVRGDEWDRDKGSL